MVFLSLLVVWLGAFAGRLYLGKSALRLPYIDRRKTLHFGFLDLFVYGTVAWLAYIAQYTSLNIIAALLYGFGSRTIVGLFETYLKKKGINPKMF